MTSSCSVFRQQTNNFLETASWSRFFRLLLTEFHRHATFCNNIVQCLRINPSGNRLRNIFQNHHRVVGNHSIGDIMRIMWNASEFRMPTGVCLWHAWVPYIRTTPFRWENDGSLMECLPKTSSVPRWQVTVKKWVIIEAYCTCQHV